MLVVRRLLVPRSWSLVWLAQAHREPPVDTPREWREHWEAESDRFGQSPPPERYLDAEDFVDVEPAGNADANAKTVERALSSALQLLGGSK